MANNTVLELIIIANKNTDDTLDELFNPMIKDWIYAKKKFAHGGVIPT